MDEKREAASTAPAMLKINVRQRLSGVARYVRQEGE
jgi:hypothetical protein